MPLALAPAQSHHSPFRAESHPADADFAAAAQRDLDATWALALELLGEPRVLRPAMTVHVYRDRADYIAAAEACGGPDPRVFPGFADFPSRTAHVFGGDGALHEGGELTPGIRPGIVHEAMHLAAAAVTGYAARFRPRWYVEGLAMWAEVAVARPSDGEHTEPGQERGPGDGYAGRFSAAMARAMLRDGRIVAADRILRGDTGDLARTEEYPVHRLLFELLMEDHGDAMRRWLRTSPDFPSSPAVPQQYADSLRRELGEGAWAGLDEALHARIEEQAEGVPEDLFGPPPDQRGQPGDGDFHPGSPDVRWTGEARTNRLALTAKVTIRNAGCKQTDFVFGRHGRSWLRVSLVPGAGVLVLAREQDGDEPGGWEVLARSATSDEPAIGEAVAVRITARLGSVTVDLDGRRAVQAKTGTRPIRGRWGIGGPQGSRASWRGVRVR